MYQQNAMDLTRWFFLLKFEIIVQQKGIDILHYYSMRQFTCRMFYSYFWSFHRIFYLFFSYRKQVSMNPYYFCQVISSSTSTVNYSFYFIRLFSLDEFGVLVSASSSQYPTRLTRFVFAYFLRSWLTMKALEQNDLQDTSK